MSDVQKWSQLGVIVALAVIVAGLVIRTYSQNLSRKAILVRLFALNLIVVGIGIGTGSFFGTGSFYPPIFAIIATGMLTFFGFVGPSVHDVPDARIEDRDIRTAIAASITMMYVVAVGYGIFVVGSQADPVAQSLLNSFSTVVGTVIAFYFGASAYLEGKGKTPGTQETKTSKQD